MIAHNGFPKRRSRKRARRAGFTLTELMVVILVIGILASSMLFAMYGATTTAKENRTKTQITKLHDLVMARWESYRTRPVRLLMEYPLPPAVPTQLVTPTKEVRRNAKAMAGARLSALRDLMRLEMPDRISDVLDNPVGFTFAYDNASPPSTATVSVQRPAISYQYLKRARAVYDSNTRLWSLPPPPNRWTEQFQDAECLYMIVASIRDISSNGLDFVHEGEIGDVDEDGMPEILDAWDRPIVFIRWPAGFIAHPGPDYNYSTADDIPSYSALQSFVVDAADQYVEPEDRDPFDPLRVDNWKGVVMPSAPSGGSAKYYFNYKLYPLVCSGGPDEVWDLVRFDFDPNGDPSALIPFDYYRKQNNPYGRCVGVHQQFACGSHPWWKNDPYSVLPTSGRRLGEPFLNSYGYVDNITNHALGE